MDILIQLITIVLGAFIVLFLPGFVLSYVFFQPGKIDVIERLALSIALSLAVVPLMAFYANLMGIPINKTSVIVEIFIIVGIAGGIVWLRRKNSKRTSP